MKKFLATLLLLSLANFAISARSHADWQADFKKTNGPKTSEIGHIYFKGEKIRMDGLFGDSERKKSKGPGAHDFSAQRVVMDHAANKTLLISDTDKKYMESPQRFTKDQHHSMLNCMSSDYESCLKREGMVKVSTQNWEGHTCDIYEGKKSGKTVQIWHARDLAEVPVVRVTHVENGATEEEMHLENIKVGSISESVFAVPAGYSKMDPMADAMKGIQGAMKDMPPEQRAKIMEMMKKYKQGN